MNYVPTFFESDISDIESCEGHIIKLRNGSLLKDLTGGITSHAILGWANEDIISVVTEQLRRYTHLDYKTFHDPLRESLANKLVAGAPYWASDCKLGVFYPGLSGSDAVEGAIKLAYQFHCCRGQSDRTEIISFKQSYHGSTAGSLSIGDRPNLALYSGLLPKNVHRLDEVNIFRPPAGVESDSDLLAYGISDFEATLKTVGPQRVCCVVGETISGGLTGYVPRPPTYWQLIKQICRKHDIIFILDEVICGPGATGTYYCWEQDFVVPDITVLGKTLAGGYLPCNALVVEDYIFETIKSSHGRIQQSSTFQGHSLAMAVASHVQEKVQKDTFLTQVANKASAVTNLITHRLEDSDRFAGCTGRGLRYSIQLTGSEADSFARCVTRRCETEAQLIVDGKWHRFTFSPQLDLKIGELLDLTSRFCDIFLEVDRSNNHASDKNTWQSDPQRRY